jgi:hypothetical protein
VVAVVAKARSVRASFVHQKKSKPDPAVEPSLIAILSFQNFHFGFDARLGTAPERLDDDSTVVP